MESFGLLSGHKEVQTLLQKKIKAFNLLKLEKVLNQCASFQAPYGGKLSSFRAEFILRLTKRRLRLALDKLNELH